MKAKKHYIVAATPRTGSSLLCEGLRSTHLAGNPGEVFAPAFRGIWCKYFSLNNEVAFDDYFHAALKYGRGANGVYGLKIQWMHLATLAKELSFARPSADLLETLFPGAAYINIVRRNRREQALSWYRAIATNEWWRRQTAENGPRSANDLPFDLAAVQALETTIERQQHAWERYFQRRQIQPLIVEYEVLAKHYEEQILRVLAFLGLNAKEAARLGPPQLVKQADEINARWYQQMESAVDKEAQHG